MLGNRIRAADALLEALNTHPDPRVGLVPLAHQLVLHLQGIQILTFVNEDHELRYCTLCDPELRPAFEEFLRVTPPKYKQMPAGPHEFCAHRFAIDPDGRLTGLEEDEEAEAELTALLWQLQADREHGRLVIRAIHDRLAAAEHNEDRPRSTPVEERSVPGAESEAKLLGGVCRALEEAFKQAMDAPSVRYLNNERLSVPNLFCIFRTSTNTRLRCKDMFDYTARWLLPECQQAEIRAAEPLLAGKASDSEADPMTARNLIESIQTPLGNETRFIADSAFCSGCVDFSQENFAEGRDRIPADDAIEKARRVAESCLFNLVLSAAGYPPNSARTLYAPIPVSGVPWLALMTLIPDRDDKARPLLFYNGIVPRFAASIRTALRREYMQALVEVLERWVFKDVDDAAMLVGINDEWKQIACIYPYDQARLHAVEGAADRCADATITFPRRAAVHLILEVNPNCPRTMGFDLLDTREAHKQLSREADRLRGAHEAATRTTLEPSSSFVGSYINAWWEREYLTKAANTNHSILLLGESGVGKEVIAGEIHRRSPRRNQAFVAVNCATLPATLVESLLFGHERGAFTGAHRRRDGEFHKADGGTLFLDEIGDMPPESQAKLNRVLLERRVTRLGAETDGEVDVRVVAATCMPENLRGDLLNRFVWKLEVPPLRDRGSQEIGELATFFLLKHSSGTKRLSDAANESLRKRDWKDNVRELESAIRRACVIADDRTYIEPGDLFGSPLRSSRTVSRSASTSALGAGRGQRDPSADTLPDRVARDVEDQFRRDVERWFHDRCSAKAVPNHLQSSGRKNDRRRWIRSAIILVLCCGFSKNQIPGDFEKQKNDALSDGWTLKDSGRAAKAAMVNLKLASRDELLSLLGELGLPS